MDYQASLGPFTFGKVFQLKCLLNQGIQPQTLYARGWASTTQLFGIFVGCSAFTFRKVWNNDQVRMISSRQVVLSLQNGLIEVKEEGFPSGFAFGKSLGAALPALGKPRPSRPFYFAFFWIWKYFEVGRGLTSIPNI